MGMLFKKQQFQLSFFFNFPSYIWKTGKKGKLREDHMKLKINGLSCIYGLYAHSALLSTFHRRCYWLLARPNVILVHYLNVVPKGDAVKLYLSPMLTSNDCGSAKSTASTSKSSNNGEFNRDTVMEQLCPMFGLPFPMAEILSDEDDTGENVKQRVSISAVRPFILLLIFVHHYSMECYRI